MSGECTICGRVFGFDKNFDQYHSVVVDRLSKREKYFGLCSEHYDDLLSWFMKKGEDDE